MSHKTADQEWLVEQLKYIAQGIGKTLSPFCEVVLHDLTDSENVPLWLLKMYPIRSKERGR